MYYVIKKERKKKKKKKKKYIFTCLSFSLTPECYFEQVPVFVQHQDEELVVAQPRSDGGDCQAVLLAADAVWERARRDDAVAVDVTHSVLAEHQHAAGTFPARDCAAAE